MGSRDAWPRGHIMSDRKYHFVSANKGAVEVDVCGEYADGAVDLAVSADGVYGEFEEVYGCDAGDVMRFLVKEGVKFESRRSQLYNLWHIDLILIERDETTAGLLRQLDALSDEEVEARLYAEGL